LGEVLVVVEGVSKEYRGASLATRLLTLGRDGRLPSVALRDVTLEVRRGEILGILGPHGSGKSTLLRCMAGLTRPTGGQVRVDGMAPSGLTTAVRGRIGWMPSGDAGFHGRLTGRENLLLYAELHRTTGAPDAAVTRVLREVALGTQPDRRYAQYTAGMRARLSLARALLGEPQLLIVDGLSTALEPIVRDTLHTLLTRLAHERGLAVVLSTMDLTEAQYICDRLLVLDEGRVVASGGYMDVESHAEVLFRRDSTVEIGAWA
jgi:ABC-2 type transport system ATP-binding protein